MTPSISNILDRLTDAQRSGLLTGVFSGVECRFVEAGLMEPTFLRASYRLTPLGLEVQSALRASEGNRS